MTVPYFPYFLRGAVVIFGGTKQGSFGALIGQSDRMKKVFDLIRTASKHEIPVLVTGETGTGKELVALEIHSRSSRKDGPFVPVNMGALPTELVLSELFGHKKGAFTGAIEDKKGRFEEANGGTLLLDEVGTMDERTQVALLQVLDTGSFRPVGGKRLKKSDVRVIAASNEDLRSAVDSGEFREDLLYRLNVFPIYLPPLRARTSDIPDLADKFLKAIREGYGTTAEELSQETLKVLMKYPWPGNVRELKNVIAQGALVAEEKVFHSIYLPQRVLNCGDSPKRTVLQDTAEFRAGQGVFCEPSAAANSGDRSVAAEPSKGISLPMGLPLGDVDKVYVLKTVEFFHGNKSASAKSLGINRKTLYDMLARWEKDSSSGSV